MSKVAHYLQQHISGEVLTAPDVRRYFATDGGILALTPGIVVYPRGEQDIRKTARFTWQLAERGRVVPITSRGMGTDRSGAALGHGIMLVFPAHMNRILELDGKTGVVTVEPGLGFGKLQQTLHTHGRFLPSYPASLEYSTIGGSIANNSGGEKSVKYGSTRDFVKSLRVVLANGEAIETKRISKRELGKKMGLATFEGEIYRALDALLDENQETIRKFKLGVAKNAAGYDIFDVKRKDGSFDLTPLFVGSQGTLGIITEAVIETAPHNPETALVAGFFDDLKVAEECLKEIKKLPESPSMVEVVNDRLLEFVDKHNPNLLKGLVDKPFPKILMLVEFDNLNERLRKKMAKRTSKIFDKNQVNFRLEFSDSKKEPLRKIRDLSSVLMLHGEGNARPLPVIEDGVVPVEKFAEFVDSLYLMFEKHQLVPALWGHGADVNLHTLPMLDLGQVGDRQKTFRLLDEYYNLVISLGGSTTGQNGDGRLKAPFLKKLYGDDIYELFIKVKKILDPYGTLNPGVKVNVNPDDIKSMMRSEYSLRNLQHLPRS